MAALGTGGEDEGPGGKYLLFLSARSLWSLSALTLLDLRHAYEQGGELWGKGSGS